VVNLGNNELVELLKELANQMGIAVDWTSENIRPYIVDIIGRLAKYEIFTSVIWILFFVIVIFIASMLLRMSYKEFKNEENYYWDEEVFGGTAVLLGIVILGFSVGIICQCYDIGKAIYMPEVLLIEQLKSLSK
jgi:hypothetical protein